MKTSSVGRCHVVCLRGFRWTNTLLTYAVQRSPDFSLKFGDGFDAFWSHHEKYVVVDNRIAFLGGIDLCYG